jgi:putative transposase
LVREFADDDIDIAVARRMLAVSRSSYYDCSAGLASRTGDEYLLKLIEQMYADRETYCSPLVHAELRLGLGLPVNSSGSPR